jgi:hypothetical protein
MHGRVYRTEATWRVSERWLQNAAFSISLRMAIFARQPLFSGRPADGGEYRYFNLQLKFRW